MEDQTTRNKGLIRDILSGNLDRRFVRLYLSANWLTMGILVAVSELLASSYLASGILAGGIIANLNCIGLDRDCQRLARLQSLAAYYGGLAVRLGLIALAVLVILLVFPEVFSPVGLFVGLSVGVINFYLLVLAMIIYRIRFKEAV